MEERNRTMIDGVQLASLERAEMIAVEHRHTKVCYVVQEAFYGYFNPVRCKPVVMTRGEFELLKAQERETGERLPDTYA